MPGMTPEVLPGMTPEAFEAVRKMAGYPRRTATVADSRGEREEGLDPHASPVRGLVVNGFPINAEKMRNRRQEPVHAVLPSPSDPATHTTAISGIAAAENSNAAGVGNRRMVADSQLAASMANAAAGANRAAAILRGEKQKPTHLAVHATNRPRPPIPTVEEEYTRWDSSHRDRDGTRVQPFGGHEVLYELTGQKMPTPPNHWTTLQSRAYPDPYSPYPKVVVQHSPVVVNGGHHGLMTNPYPLKQYYKDLPKQRPESQEASAENAGLSYFPELKREAWPRDRSGIKRSALSEPLYKEYWAEDLFEPYPRVAYAKDGNNGSTSYRDSPQPLNQDLPQPRIIQSVQKRENQALKEPRAKYTIVHRTHCDTCVREDCGTSCSMYCNGSQSPDRSTEDLKAPATTHQNGHQNPDLKHDLTGPESVSRSKKGDNLPLKADLTSSKRIFQSKEGYPFALKSVSTGPKSASQSKEGDNLALKPDVTGPKSVSQSKEGDSLALESNRTHSTSKSRFGEIAKLAWNTDLTSSENVSQSKKGDEDESCRPEIVVAEIVVETSVKPQESKAEPTPKSEQKELIPDEDDGYEFINSEDVDEFELVDASIFRRCGNKCSSTPKICREWHRRLFVQMSNGL